MWSRCTVAVRGDALEVTGTDGACMRNVLTCEVFSVVAVWAPSRTTWSAWITTDDGWSAAMRVEVFHAPEVQQWLCRLPGWMAARLPVASDAHGLHLVWRSSSATGRADRTSAGPAPA